VTTVTTVFPDECAPRVTTVPEGREERRQQKRALLDRVLNGIPLKDAEARHLNALCEREQEVSDQLAQRLTAYERWPSWARTHPVLPRQRGEQP
jgi:hypothetical protein